MATLARPGVQISQVINIESPSVLTPSLRPCVVGPCFEIVDAIKDGALNKSEALVSIAPRLQGGTVSGNLQVSGLSIKIASAAGPGTVITLPTIANPAEGISIQNVLNALNKSFKAQGVAAEITFVGSQTTGGNFVITHNTKGSNSRLALEPVSDPQNAAGEAYAAMGYTVGADGLSVQGQAAYSGIEYVVPYTSFTTPKAGSPKEVKFLGDDITLYRNVSGLLTEISGDSAVSWNSSNSMPTKYENAAGNDVQVHDQRHSPVLVGGRTTMVAVPGAGKSTNKIGGFGKEASVTIPLTVPGMGAAAQGSAGISSWPDPSGACSIVVTARGFQAYKDSGNVSEIGNFAGDAGNGIKVSIENAPGGWSPETAWDKGSKTLTIQIAADDEYADLEATINSIVSALPHNGDATKKSDIDIELNMPGSLDKTELAWGNAAEAEFFLGGGEDAPNFGADASGDAQHAWILGAQGLGAADPTGSDLGISGMTLEISADGEAATEVAFSGTSVLDALNAVPGILAEMVNPTNTEGTTVSNVLRIKSDSTDGHDSTLALSGPNAVIEALFSGTPSGSDAVSAGAFLESNFWGSGAVAASDARAAHIVASTDYNSAAGIAAQQARLKTGIKLTLDSVTMLPHIETSFAQSDLEPGSTLGDAIAATGPNNLPVTLSITTQAGDHTAAFALGSASAAGNNTGANIVNMAQLVAELNNDLGPNNVAAFVQNGKLCFAGTTTAVTSLKLNALETLQTTQAADHAGSIAIKAAFDEAMATTTAGGDGTIFSTAAAASEVVSTATTATIVLSDDSANSFKWKVDSVSNNLSHIVAPAAAPIATNSSALTAKILDHVSVLTGLPQTATAGDNDKWNGPNYSNGELDVIWASAQDGATANLDRPCVAATTAATSGSVTYTRAWDCSLTESGPGVPGYVTTHHGSSDRVIAGDRLYNNSLNVPLGTITQVQDLALPTPDGSGVSFTGAVLVIDTASQDNLTKYANWYVRANNLIFGDLDESSMRRVEPESNFSDLEGWYRIKPSLNRGPDGIVSSGNADIYAQYRALRLDVTSASPTAELLPFNSISEVEATVGPIQTNNPLAWALYCALLQSGGAPSQQFAMGVDDVSADAPEGTIAAYARAFEFLGTKEVYTIAPLTHSIGVHQLLSAHVLNMSEPENKKERIGLVCPALPTEKNPTIGFSDSFKITSLGGTRFELEAQGDTANIPMALNGLLDANGNGLVAGVGAAFSPAQGVYLDREGDAFKYLVTKIVSATTIEIDAGDLYGAGMGPGTGGNDDAYFKTGNSALEELATFETDGESCSIGVRQAALDKTTSAGKLGICEAMAEITGGATGYKNRRLVFMQPESVQMPDMSGVPVSVPGYYLCAAVGAMVGLYDPAQPFTNFPMVGFTAPLGSSDIFSEPQMATAAAGGVYWVIQDVEGGSLASRHQLTTDVTGLKTRELSIIKSVDYVAKILRNQVKGLIGRNNITPGLLDTISVSLQSALFSTIGTAVASAALTKIGVSSESKDTVACEVALVPFYPANVIKITIFV